MSEIEKRIKVKILRFNPKKDKEPHFETYEVPISEGMSVLNVLDYIHKNIDRSLAFYYSCRIGKCKGCTMMINGKAKEACTTPAREDLTIEPLVGYEVIKDLVVDLEKRKIS
jgi:succinate dehydrogenase/fumarate reductase iron-sulfur protein